MRKQWRGFRIGGLHLFSLQFYDRPGYIFKFASWHNPAHMCWLWYLQASLTQADERKAFRIYHAPGFQARTVLQLWRLRLTFCWQAEGWYRTHGEMRTTRTLKRLGMRA